MRRSSFVLGVLGLVTISLSTAACRKSRASRDREAVAETTTEVKKATDGVADDRIRLGQVASLTGAQAGLGAESYRGAMAYFLEVNAKGGVHGRTIELVPADDKYTLDGGEAATERLMADDEPFGFVSATGTEPSTGIVKALKKHEAKGVFLWGSTSGAEVLRTGEYAKLAFNLRGSLDASATDVANAFAGAGFKKVAVVSQDDGFGKSAAGSAKRASEAKGLAVVAELSVPKTTKPDTGDAKEIVAKAKAAGAEAIFIAATYNPATVIIRDARDSGWNVPVGVMSSPDTMVRQLVAIEKKTGKRMTNAVLGCADAPPVNATDLPSVREYRELSDKRNPQLPREIADPNYRPLRYSTNALESFIGAKALVEALNRAGRNLTRDGLRKAAESMVNWDAGLGQPLTWGPGDNQGFDSVWLPGIKNDELTLVTDMKKYLTDKPEPVVKGDASAAPSASAAPGVKPAAAKK